MDDSWIEASASVSGDSFTDISLLGLTSSGKSTFLAVLDRAMQRKKWLVTPLDTPTIAAMREAHDTLFKECKFPPQTQPASLTEYKFSFTRYSRTRIALPIAGVFVIVILIQIVTEVALARRPRLQGARQSDHLD